jgi:hypothetical protein
MKQTIFLITLFLLCKTPAYAQKIKFLTPELMDLGRVLEGTVVKDTIRFVNTGKVPIKIARVKSVCSCTVADIKSTEISPGDTAEISFSLNTKSMRGVVRKPLSVVFVKNILPEQKIQIQASVYNSLDITPKYIFLQRIKKDADASVVNLVKIRNHTINDVKLLKIYSDNTLVQVEPQRGTIPAGKNQSLKITLKPQQTGRYHINITIETDCKNKTRMNIPVYVEIIE